MPHIVQTANQKSPLGESGDPEHLFKRGLLMSFPDQSLLCAPESEALFILGLPACYHPLVSPITWPPCVSQNITHTPASALSHGCFSDWNSQPQISTWLSPTNHHLTSSSITLPFTFLLLLENKVYRAGNFVWFSDAFRCPEGGLTLYRDFI